MNKSTKYISVAICISLMTLLAMLAYTADKLVLGVLFEVLILISIVPSWYLVNLKSDFDNDNAYQSFPYHLITYVCNILISFGFYMWGTVDYEIVLWKALLWLPFVMFHGIGFMVDYKKRFKNVKFD